MEHNLEKKKKNEYDLSLVIYYLLFVVVSCACIVENNG